MTARTVSAAYEAAEELFARHPEMVQSSQSHGWTRSVLLLRWDHRLYSLSIVRHDGVPEDGCNFTDFIVGPKFDLADREVFGPGVPSMSPRADLANAVCHGTPVLVSEGER